MLTEPLLKLCVQNSLQQAKGWYIASFQRCIAMGYGLLGYVCGLLQYIESLCKGWLSTLLSYFRLWDKQIILLWDKPTSSWQVSWNSWCNYAYQIPLPLWEFRGVPQFFMVEKHLSSFDGNYDHNAYFRPHLWGGYCILAFRTVTIGNTLLKAMHWSAALISRPIWIGRSITSFLDGKGGQFEEIDGAGWTAGA